MSMPMSRTSPAPTRSLQTATPKWDAGADYRLPVAGSEVTLFLALNNITDEEIRLSTSFLRDVAPEAGFLGRGGDSLDRSDGASPAALRRQ